MYHYHTFYWSVCPKHHNVPLSSLFLVEVQGDNALSVSDWSTETTRSSAYTRHETPPSVPAVLTLTLNVCNNDPVIH